MGYESSVDIGKDAERLKRARKHASLQKPADKPRKERGIQSENWVKDNIAPYRTWIYVIILIMLSAFLYSQTAFIPVADDLAEDYAKQTLREQIYPQVSQRNPNLPVESKQEITEQAIEEAIQSENSRQAIQKEAQRIREYYQNPEGVTYTYRYDAYYYLRQADNLITKGILGEYENEGLPFDNLRAAPEEIVVRFSLAPYFIAGTAYLIDFNSPSAEEGALWMPILLGVISSIIFFFLASTFFNKEVGFISGLAFVISPAIFQTFKGGSADTPPLNVFWTLLIILFLAKGFQILLKIDYKNWKEWIKPAAYLVMAGITLLLFKNTWRGYFYIIPIICAGVLLHAFLAYFRKKKKEAGYLLSAIAGISIIAAFYYRNSFQASLVLSRLNLAESSSIFPTAYPTIGELQSLSFGSYIDHYGLLLLCLALLGLGILAYREWKNPSEKSILLAWSSLSILPLLSQRFDMYALIPLALLFGLGAYETAKFLSKWNFGVARFWRTAAWIIVIAGIFTASAIPNTVAAMNQYPYADDAIYDLSQHIKRNTTENTIINTWWDYGYVYEYFADRATTFDGGSFDPHRLYWVSRALMSKNENVSSGIFRMLNCGGERKAFDLASKAKTSESVAIIENAMKYNKSEAEMLYLNNELPAEIADYTHCNARPGMFIVSSDMVDKLPPIYSFSEWNFDYRISMAEDHRILKGRCSRGICDYGIRYSLKDEFVWWNGRTPKKFIYINRDFTNKTVLDFEQGIDATILVSGERLIILPLGFDNTMMIRGLYFNDLENFELFDIQDQRKRLVAYRIKY